MFVCFRSAVSLFTAIKRWEDSAIPIATFIVRMLGVNFTCVEYVFIAAVKGTTVDLGFSMNCVQLFVIPDGN